MPRKTKATEKAQSFTIDCYTTEEVELVEWMRARAASRGVSFDDYVVSLIAEDRKRKQRQRR